MSCEEAHNKKRQARELFENASSAETKGNSEEAVRLYRAAFKLDPDLEQELREGSSGANIADDIKEYMTVNRSAPAGFRTFDALQMFGPVSAGDEQEQRIQQQFQLRAQMKAYLDSEGGSLMACEVEDPSKLTAANVLASRVSNVANGIISRYGVGQSKMNWLARARAKKAFKVALGCENIETDKVITSFDGANLIVNNEVHPDGGGSSDESWLHFDAVGHDCANYIQGVANFLDATESTEPSFVVFPKTHKTLFPKIFGDSPGRNPRDGTGIYFLSTVDFKRMKEEWHIQERPFRVPMKPGSLVMWYSSTLHCNVGCAPRAPEKQNKAQMFRRVASYVCMQKFDPKKDDPEGEIAERRNEFFSMWCVSTTHAPDWGRMSGAPATAEMKQAGVVCCKVEDLPEGAAELL